MRFNGEGYDTRVSVPCSFSTLLNIFRSHTPSERAFRDLAAIPIADNRPNLKAYRVEPAETNDCVTAEEFVGAACKPFVNNSFRQIHRTRKQGQNAIPNHA